MREIDLISKELKEVKNKLQSLKDNNNIDDEFYNLLKREGELKIEFVEAIQDSENLDMSIVSLRDAIEDYKNMPVRPKYETGVSVIDTNLNGGFEQAQFIVIAGEKGAGKTLLTMQILFNVSSGFKTVLFTLEMPTYKIVERLLKKEDSFTSNILNNLGIADKKFTLEQIKTLIKFEAKKNKTKFFVIDSFMKIQTTKNFKSVNEKYSHISNTLSRLAVELDVIIFAVAQMSKEDIKNKRLSLKNSGDVEYDADIIFYLLKDKNDYKKRVLVCDKNRQNGNEFKESVFIDTSTLEITENETTIIDFQDVTV